MRMNAIALACVVHAGKHEPTVAGIGFWARDGKATR
jgi:hypothetical protein